MAPGGASAFPVFGMIGLEPAPALVLLPGLAGVGLPGGLRLDELARGRARPDSRGGRLHQRPVALLALGQRQPGLLALPVPLLELACDGKALDRVLDRPVQVISCEPVLDEVT